MFVNNKFDAGVAPDIAVQHLARKLLHVLYVDDQPLVGRPSRVTCLQQQKYTAIILPQSQTLFIDTQ